MTHLYMWRATSYAIEIAGGRILASHTERGTSLKNTIIIFMNFIRC
jgi:hypothetical protein